MQFFYHFFIVLNQTWAWAKAHLNIQTRLYFINCLSDTHQIQNIVNKLDITFTSGRIWVWIFKYGSNTDMAFLNPFHLYKFTFRFVNY